MNVLEYLVLLYTSCPLYWKQDCPIITFCKALNDPSKYFASLPAAGEAFAAVTVCASVSQSSKFNADLCCLRSMAQNGPLYRQDCVDILFLQERSWTQFAIGRQCKIVSHISTFITNHLCSSDAWGDLQLQQSRQEHGRAPTDHKLVRHALKLPSLTDRKAENWRATDYLSR